MFCENLFKKSASIFNCHAKKTKLNDEHLGNESLQTKRRAQRITGIYFNNSPEHINELLNNYFFKGTHPHR